MNTIFSASSILVMPFWFLMIFLPHWRWTRRIIGSPWIIAPAALLYALLVLPDFTTILGAVFSPTLDGIQQLLATPSGATISWVHFLAFDLFVARWAFMDGQKAGISSLLVSPTLFFILMLGPFGFLLYLSVRTVVLNRRREPAPQRAGS